MNVVYEEGDHPSLLKLEDGAEIVVLRMKAVRCMDPDGRVQYLVPANHSHVVALDRTRHIIEED